MLYYSDWPSCPDDNAAMSILKPSTAWQDINSWGSLGEFEASMGDEGVYFGYKDEEVIDTSKQGQIGGGENVMALKINWINRNDSKNACKNNK